EALADFVQTRGSYVAQTSLYGYLKNRMGISYPKMFEDEVMAKSINIAKWRTYGSCLSDLSIFASATAGSGNLLTDARMSDLARHCFDYAVSESFDDEDAQALKTEILAAFDGRLAEADWPAAPEGENAFLASPVDLLRFAPIADHLKEFDVEIVVNSTRFRWRDIRTQLRERIDSEAIAQAWNEHSSQNHEPSAP
ncbi:MAG: hypothetical protein AAF441_25320, partial [Pseudomonadota bacterium]